MSAGEACRVRFAPSPTGSLHLGNARTALFNWLVARRGGGRFVLRVEDTDVAREQPGSEAGILEDLRWLGLEWDEGPDVGGPLGPYRQSERLPLYSDAALRLLREGSAYRCFCTDEELEAERVARGGPGGPTGYSGRCRRVDPEASRGRAERGEPFAVRFRTVPERASEDDLRISFEDRLRGEVVFSAIELGDPILLRRDGRPTYNFAVVVDDAAMEITLVVRGDDHLSNTPRQLLLYRALRRPAPEFAHLPMVRGPDGSRLSKRHGAVSVAEARARGYPPEAVLNSLALLGWSPGAERVLLTVEEMVREFDLDRVHRSAAVFDPAKLDWISGQHIRRMPARALTHEVRVWLAGSGRLPEVAPEGLDAWLADVAEMVRTSLERFDQVPERCSALFLEGGIGEGARKALRSPRARDVLAAVARLLDEGEPGDADSWGSLRNRLAGETGLEAGALLRPIRAAVTGQLAGPELDHLIPLIVRGSSLLPERVPSLAARVRSALGLVP